MDASIQLKLFATLAEFTPPDSDNTPIKIGESVQSVLERHGAPLDQVKLVFVNGVRKDLSFELSGGERVGVFPPVGGG